MTVYFTRHGHTALTGPPDRFCGSSDPPLTGKGRREVQHLAKSLAGQISPAAIYSSNMMRTLESAEILADLLAVPIVPKRDLREIDFGEWEGLTKQEAEARDPEIYAQWAANPVAVVPPGGNRPQDVVRCAEQLSQLARSQNAPILVVAHKTFLRIALWTWLGIDLSQYRSSFDVYPATLGCVVFSETCCRLTLLNWSPAACLPGSENE